MGRYTSQSAVELAQDQNRYDRTRAKGARQMQNAQSRADLEAAYARDRLAAIRAGVPESSLHPVTSGMDLGAAQRQLQFLTNGSLARATSNAPAAVANSRVPLNVNSRQSAMDAAVAASPAPFQPGHGPLRDFPTVAKGETNPAALAAGLKANLAMTQPGGLNQFASPSPALVRAAAAPQPATAQPIGRTLTAQQGDALFGAVQGANGYGSGSVRYAQKGEELPAAIVSSEGVKREGPLDLATARVDLQKRFPAIFQEGSKENAAFVEHAKKFGEASAHRNAYALMAPFDPEAQTASIPKTPAAQDVSLGETERSLPKGTLIDPNSVLGVVVHPGNALQKAVTGVRNYVAPIAKKALTAAGVTPEGIALLKNWLGGADQRVSNATGVNPDGTLARPAAQPQIEDEKKKRKTGFDNL